MSGTSWARKHAGWSTAAVFGGLVLCVAMEQSAEADGGKRGGASRSRSFSIGKGSFSGSGNNSSRSSSSSRGFSSGSSRSKSSSGSSSGASRFQSNFGSRFSTPPTSKGGRSSRGNSSNRSGSFNFQNRLPSSGFGNRFGGGNSGTSKNQPKVTLPRFGSSNSKNSNPLKSAIERFGNKRPVQTNPSKPNTGGSSIFKPSDLLKPNVRDLVKSRLSGGNSSNRIPGNSSPSFGGRRPSGNVLDLLKVAKHGIPKDLSPGKSLTGNSSKNRFTERFTSGALQGLVRTAVGQQFNLNKQFDLYRTGDVARRLHLADRFLDEGGWRKRRNWGPLSSNFRHSHFGACYAGPSIYPSYCWYPHWNGWVDWCWWDYCHPVCDPRPVYCRPVVYDPCQHWDVWDVPVWETLPVVTCGTWVDVPVVPIEAGVDVQLLAVRFVDPGHPEKELGPRYRVWVRNNTARKIDTAFNVMLLAANNEKLNEDLPQAGLRIEALDADQVQSIDIRLPFAANRMSVDEKGRPAPFSHLHVLVDSHQELAEESEENNGAVLPVGDVLPVDPATFAVDEPKAAAGGMLIVAGEGLGPEPGQVVVTLNGLEFQPEIQGWYDLGVQVKLPDLPLTASMDAELVVIRGDGAAANPIPLQLVPEGAESTAMLAP